MIVLGYFLSEWRLLVCIVDVGSPLVADLALAWALVADSKMSSLNPDNNGL